jgi:hypothetical protein
MLRELARGMRGEDVRAVQAGLNEFFRSERKALDTDGIFGGATLAAVEAFQKRNPGTGKRDGTPDGIVGGRTRRKLFPLVPYSASVTGFRLKMPSLGPSGIQPPRLGPGPLQLPGPPSQPPNNIGPFPPQLDFSNLVIQPKPLNLSGPPQKFPGLKVPVFTPLPVVAPRLQLPPVPAPSPAPTPLALNVHHFELSPGVTTQVGKPGETSFSFAVQGVVLRGDDNAAHQELAFGTEISSPNADGSDGWTMAWFLQITDVDRFGSLGLFHFWQPFAQLGGENTSKAFRPVIKGGAFPVNLGFDVSKNVSLTVTGGVAFTYDPENGRVTAGVEGSAGLVLKFDMPTR